MHSSRKKTGGKDSRRLLALSLGQSEACGTWWCCFVGPKGGALSRDEECRQMYSHRTHDTEIVDFAAFCP
jgi:hypothetical protein